MLYLVILVISTLFAASILKKILADSLLKKEKIYDELESEYTRLAKETLQLKEGNTKLAQTVSETVALYNITKDICKTLDEGMIFSIFKERVSDYLKVGDCRFLSKDADITNYKGYSILPLVIQQDEIGYLVASDIADRDKDKFQILAQQFMVGVRRALLYKKMQELSITDSLTQLFSRRHFLDRFKEELLRSKKFGHNLSFLMVDIDKFKDINDKYGHLVGDAILRGVSKTIKETVRQIDFVGRYGGEELSIVLAETDSEQARLTAERLRQAIETKIIKAYDEELNATVSIGISTFPHNGNVTNMLLEAADKALYLAKQRGRNKVCVYDRAKP